MNQSKQTAVRAGASHPGPNVWRWHAASQMLAPTRRNARNYTAYDVRQPRRWLLTAHPAPANLLTQADLDNTGSLDFLSVIPALNDTALLGPEGR